MAPVVNFIFDASVAWVSLMVIVPLARKFVDISVPGWAEVAWKLAVIVLAASIASVALQPLSGVVAWIATVVIFWGGLSRWFDCSLFVAIGIAVAAGVFQTIMLIVIIAALANAGLIDLG